MIEIKQDPNFYLYSTPDGSDLVISNHYDRIRINPSSLDELISKLIKIKTEFELSGKIFV